MSIIEQAARRLEELRRGGIEVPHHAGTGNQAPASEPTPVAVARRLAAARAATAAAPAAARPAQARAGEAQSRKIDIDLRRLAAMGYISPDSSRGEIADEFRIIKRPLLMNISGKSAAPVERANRVMVTSSLPGEGKTFVAINLAISMAMELDRTVLLVDADVARPSVLSRLGLEQAPGLLDLLSDPSLELSSVLMKTNIAGLTILPAGSPRGRATELLASDNMHRLVEDLATRYADRIIIFDAPPLLPSTESRVLAHHMGQVVHVVHAEVTPQRTVSQSLATLESCPVVMTLLNKASRSEVGLYYGYYRPLEE